jgi:hypothetical protein
MKPQRRIIPFKTKKKGDTLFGPDVMRIADSIWPGDTS